MDLFSLSRRAACGRGAAGGAHAAALAGRVRRAGAHRRPGHGAARRDRARRALLDDLLRPARAAARRRWRGSSPPRPARASCSSRRSAPARPTCAPPSQGAREARALNAARTLLFIDEIHRFNKAQQDALLPAIEDGVVTLDRRDHREPVLRGQLGAHLALPALPLRAARRRSSSSSRAAGARRCRARSRRHGRRARRRARSRTCAEHLARRRARRAQRARDRRRARGAASPASAGRDLTLDDLRDAAQKSPVTYDREDAHYDTISAFIKIDARQRPGRRGLLPGRPCSPAARTRKFIARRMVIFASEDVGNADPRALQVAVDAARAVEFVGLPECRINLSQAATYLCAGAQEQRRVHGRSTPRSTTCAARATSRRRPTCATPTTAARRNSVTARGTSTRTRTAAGSSSSTCPTRLSGRRYYVPIRGVESQLAARWEEVRRQAAESDPGGPARSGEEEQQ